MAPKATAPTKHPRFPLDTSMTQQVLLIHEDSTHAQAHEMLSFAQVVVKTRRQLLIQHGMSDHTQLPRTQGMSDLVVEFGPVGLIEPMPQLRHLDARGQELLRALRAVSADGEAVNVHVVMLRPEHRKAA